MVIERLTLPDGRELINVPSSLQVLEELGLPREQIERLMLEQAKTAARHKVQASAAAARARLAGRTDPYKLMGWNEKSARAQRVLAGAASDGDIAVLTVEAEARGRGETPEQLASKQADKALALAKATAVIDGMESTTLKAIDGKRALHTVDHLVNEFVAGIEVKLANLLNGEQ